MFTMIRIMINRPYAETRKKVPPMPPPQPAEPAEELRRSNPWQQELHRLAQSTDRPGYRRLSQMPLPSSDSGQVPPRPTGKPTEGTLTNLRNWWGQGLNPNTGQQASSVNRQFPPKKISRWQQ